MTKTINGLTTATSAAAADFLAIWRAANGDTRKITKANFMGGVLSGGGTIATGGNTLTVSGTSTINGSVVGNISGGGTLATGSFTLTVPATGTAVTTSATQTLTNKTLTNPKISGIASTSIDVANNTIGALTLWTTVNNGLIFVHNVTYGTVCAFLVRAGSNTTVELGFDNTSAYSHTVDTANSVNFYYDSTYGYVIQNKMGVSCFIRVVAIGA